jgi:fibronectin-binding autotransporter adhesin
MKAWRFLLLFAALVLGASWQPRQVWAADGTWTATTSGSWGTAGNWLNNTIGTGTGSTATFGADIASDVIVTNNQQRAIGSLIFGTVGGTNSGNWLVSGSQITVTNGNPATNATITVNSLGSATISSVIASATANNALLVKNGTGKLILTNTANSIGNRISITAGTLEIGNERVLGAQPGAYTADQLQISNGAMLRTTASATISSSRGITIGSGGGTISVNGGLMTLATRVSGSGNTLTVTGSNALALTTSAVGTNVDWDFAANAGVRAFFEGANALGIGSVRVRNAVKLTSQNMTTGTLTNAVTLDDGAGISARSSGGAQTYTNVALPSTGSLLFNNDDQATAALTIASGRELTGNLTINTQQSGTNAVGDVTLSGIFSGTVGSLIKTGTGASGRLILTGANTYGGNTTINSGTLQLGNGSTAGSLSTSSVITGSAGATLAFNRSDTITSGVEFNSAITGGINVAQVGSGTVILTASNTIGKTSITNGVLQISNANQLGSAPGSFTADQLTISNGATLRTTTGGLTLPVNRGITIGSGGGKLDANGGQLIINSRFTGDNQTVTVTGSGGLTLTNNTGTASDVDWDFAMNANQRVFFSGSNSNSLGTGNVLVRSGVRLVSQSVAPPSGEVTNAVTLESGAGLSARSTGGAVTYTTVTLPSSGSLIFNKDDLATSALTIASGRELTGDLTIDTSQQAANAVGDVTLSGNFSGASGGITKIGTGASGRLILGGVNTYGGNTTISTGTLALAATSSIANSALINVASGASFDVSAVSGGFSLAAGQVLGGSGTVVGNVTALGTIAPGSSPGTLTFTQGLTLAAGGNYNWQILDATGTAGAATGWDLANVGGVLDVASTSGDPFKINLWSLSSTGPDVNGNALNFNSSQGYTWTIASATGGITGFDAGKFQIITGATNGTGGFTNAFTGTFSLALSGSTDLNLVYTAGAPAAITINVPSGTQTQTAAGYPLLSGSTPVEKIGAGTAVLDQANTLTGPTTVSQGTLELATADTLSSSAVTVAAGATLSVGPQVAAVVPALVNNGLVDVGLGGLTVTSGQTAEGIVAAIIAGRTDGTWSGTSGITSSAAATQSERAVGWLNNGDGSFTVAFGAAGDWNLDGVVDFTDVIQFVSANLFNTGLPATWADGDFDYNGVVDFDDIIAAQSANLFNAGPYNTGSGGLSALDFGGGDDLGLMSGGFAAVPEPSAWLLLTIGAGCLAGGSHRDSRRRAIATSATVRS